MTKTLLAAMALTAAAVSQAQTVHLPISAFTSVQSFTSNWSQSSNGNWMFVDYLGQWNGYLMAAGHADLGTTVTGDVAETPLKTGGCKVHVTLHADNAYCWALNDANGGATSMGYRFGEILAGATPALGSADMVLDWTSTDSAGQANLDILAWGNNGTHITFQASGTGPLRDLSGYPEGTPGYVRTTQVGILGRTQGKFALDGFPTEYVRFGPIG